MERDKDIEQALQNVECSQDVRPIDGPLLRNYIRYLEEPVKYESAAPADDGVRAVPEDNLYEVVAVHDLSIEHDEVLIAGKWVSVRELVPDADVSGLTGWLLTTDEGVNHFAQRDAVFAVRPKQPATNPTLHSKLVEAMEAPYEGESIPKSAFSLIQLNAQASVTVVAKHYDENSSAIRKIISVLTPLNEYEKCDAIRALLLGEP